MTLKQLQTQLQQLSTFSNPIVDLEQYPTSPHLASHMIYTAESSFGDIMGHSVLDLGCGCGALTYEVDPKVNTTLTNVSLAAALSDASFICAVDIDPSAIVILQQNRHLIADHISTPIDVILCDISCQLPIQPQSYDVVIMNPPFGTRKAGIDILFLEEAFRCARRAIYSLHKTSTRSYLQKKGGTQWVGKVIAEMRFDLGNSYKFHKKGSVDIKVDLWRFVRR